MSPNKHSIVYLPIGHNSCIETKFVCSVNDSKTDLNNTEQQTFVELTLQ
jgi:hypothetical protein